MLVSPAWPDGALRVDTAAIAALVDGSADPATTVDATAGRPAPPPAHRLTVAQTLASTTPPLVAGTAGQVLATLAAVAAADVATARVVEPHLDALTILAQAGVAVPAGSTWGVYAAEAPGLRLEGHPTEDGGVVLDGTKPWCSLASTLSHALVTAHVGQERRLVAVSLRQDGVVPHDVAWVARGLPDVPSGPVGFSAVRADPVGEPGWYLRRPGFAWGGIGVAACWWGGAVGLARVLRSHAAARPDSELLQAALGSVVADLADAEDALAGAARRIDDSADSADSSDQTDATDDGTDWPLLAQVVRSRVRRAVDAVRTEVVRSIGPGPLTSDPAVAARVADLELYVLQDHGDRDLARIGRMVLERGGVAW
ncbi:acyl-CoA/acyl-ACP dehydrogenase [Curtobacterium herbarum]|uniref:Acyl-CoA dehydrogenase family protein n=1 Tax=Curtobacterium herbarum TaxID=150122 RepID=A0ABP4K8D1_9MICO|nr:acyl-CoA/acyl-ACP dehydrogenase [Curtobacterium herbarum]MBM7474855.1 alkylation response protein AidB-like acyl-CoA dehydrogenase [Curtobacterium herbarum]MCS6545503.1 acyl-CoA/acyl-ACP dehydrogenase [Curtobacterium herbarum]